MRIYAVHKNENLIITNHFKRIAHIRCYKLIKFYFMETYDYVIYVNGNKYAEANSHQKLIEYIEQIRVERGEGAKYTITLNKI